MYEIQCYKLLMIELEQIVNYVGGFNKSIIEGNVVLKTKHIFSMLIK